VESASLRIGSDLGLEFEKDLSREGL